ncbi:hypothetical protein HYX10_01230 [Candidatus Woesearchaeota archaeon]|nr:hypothetical protein [Candidatus Woesearchaeota archaeon]
MVSTLPLGSAAVNNLTVFVKAFEGEPPEHLNPERNPAHEVYVEPLVEEFGMPMTLIHDEPGLGPFCDTQVRIVAEIPFMKIVGYFSQALRDRNVSAEVDVQIAERTAVAVFEYKSGASKDKIYEAVRATKEEFSGIEDLIRSQ